jgi:hypothetical protein
MHAPQFLPALSPVTSAKALYDSFTSDSCLNTQEMMYLLFYKKERSMHRLGQNEMKL